ncbi:hypothetical protein Pcinc_014846 [Petrolisthes cinctipes]|uniref:Uncharacterized protein n=1 Tax=Petrolisthes cinctipes TaxID=88211 RepID=A0AAE1KSV0_PETCI|nr:hypothetical protein Pcinc_014846 [Petrolisthes cinctipes]
MKHAFQHRATKLTTDHTCCQQIPVYQLSASDMKSGGEKHTGTQSWEVRAFHANLEHKDWAIVWVSSRINPGREQHRPPASPERERQYHDHISLGLIWTPPLLHQDVSVPIVVTVLFRHLVDTPT